ncbi:hypothetical protein XENOCAPTIV_024969 [Xenoophorus captivus]|uniref:Uncharacterized protein n=1 Tax=Xenoophorus captivus TaxID=1517983 RepID=A0ABV0S421_9TELE
MSAKSVQSCMSEISITSAERTQSSLSAKSFKSSTTEVYSGKSPDESNIVGPTQTKSESVLSCKSERSASSAKSTKSNGLDIRDEKMVDDDEHVERAPSNLSAKSEKSTKSNVSKGCKTLVSKVCLKHKAVNPDRRGAENGSENKPLSPQSVRSNTSVKSNRSKCCIDSLVAKRLDISDNENDKETNIERARSSMSTGSVQSSVSDISIKYEERTASALSEKSHASLISEITNISEVPSGIPALPEEVDNEDKERTQSVMSVKSTNSSVSDKSTKSARLDHEKHTERSSSNLSVKSGRSAKSNLSKRSEVYEAHLKNSAYNCDVRIVDGESEGSTISVVSAQSVRSQCERFDDDNNENENHERPPSSTSAKSVLSCISQKSAKSADRPPSASSAKSAKSHTSAKSVQSNISDAKSGKTVEMYKKGTESHEKTNSALSSKTAKSTASTKSSKVKEHGEDGQHKDRNPSSMSARSATSAKSNVSAVTCEPSSKNGDEDTSQEDNEIRSVSSMSIHSAKSDISARSGMSKCSTDIPGHEIMKRPDSPSAMSAQILAGSTEGCACDLDQVERPISNLSIKSAKSATSATSCVSGTSTKSKASNIPSEQEIAASDIEGQGNSSSSQMTKSNVSGCSKKSRCSDVSDSILNEENTNERSSVNTSANVKTTKSSTSTKSCELQKPGEQRNVENMNSNSSIKSTTSRHSDGRSNDSETLDLSPENFVSSVSTKSKVSHSHTANEEDPSQRTHSALSIKSDVSSRTIQSNRSHITPTKGIRKDDDKLIDPNIPTEESDAHSDADALEKCERTQSPASKKSPKSKYDFVLSEESSKYVEERTGSPVSTKSDLSEALSRSEVPYVTVEESEDRSTTATSLKSKASGRSKKSKTSEIQGARSARKSQSSLSVHSHLSVKSKKTNVTDMSTASVVSKNSGEHVTPTEDSTPCLYEVKDGPTDKKNSKTKRSRRQRTENADICLNKHPIICHADSAESDKSHTLSCSDNMKEICETSSPGESESHVSKRIVYSLLKAADTVSDKSDMDAHDFELVPSILPNASPTEVVNEWLKTLPTESDLYDMEELNENGDGVKDNVAAEEANGTEDAEKNESEAENLKEVNGMDNVHNDDSQKSTESPNEDKTYTQRECGSEMFNSSIQVMKVLLNSKLDRCNSLPEISPVYGRKLSTSAKGLLDCFVKLRIIDYDPENANEKNERYQELVSILQSLWLSDPPEKEHIQSTTDHHSVEGEYNHTSSSGVDVNSGSTGSGKSSDGVKSSNDVNVDGSQPQNSLTLIDKAHNETDAQSKPEIEEVKQEEDDPATDETIRTIDSPKELPEPPSSSNKSSGESSVNDKKISKRLSQDPDPVWVLTLLNKIEKQFMTHYISAMKELKNRSSLEDTDQLDKMIDELKSEVHKKIQISIDREVRKIRGRGRLPKPPNEAISRGSTKQTEERRRRMKIKQQQSMDSQAEKSESTTGTSDSDQRGENIDEYCPCETCVEKKLTSRPPLSAEVKRTAPVVKDYDLKKILLMKTTTDWEAPCANDNDTTVETLVEKVIVGAMKEIESNEVYKVRDKPPEFSADEKEKDNVSQDGQATIKETGKDFAIDNEGEISKAGNERPESESGATSTVGEITSGVETASEEGTDDAITPSGEIGSNANIELEEKDTDMLRRVSVDEDDEEITETMSSEHRYITATTKELPNHLNEINDDTDANTEVQSKEESEQEGKDALVKEVSSTKLNANHGEAMKDWLNMKRKLLPPVRIVLQGKKKKQSMMNAKNNDTVMINEMVKDRTEEDESDAEIAVVQKTTVLSENASSEEADYSEAEHNEPAVEVNKTQTTDVKFSEEEDEEAEMDEESFLEMISNATLSDDEKAETSSIATSEHGSENDMIVEQTPVATLTDQNSDMEETGEGTTSDHDSVEESGGTSDGDETEDEKETTINELSSIQEEEATEDELSVISETELKKHLITVVGYEDAEETNEAESEVKTSERDVEKDSIADEKKTISPANSDDSPDENEAATAKFSEGPDEGAEDGMGVRNQPAVTGEHKTVLPPRTDQESDDEKDKEGRRVDPKEEMEAADVLKSSSVKSEDENEESETTASEHKSEKDAAEEEGTGTDEEKLSAISANASGDENRDLSIEDESSEEHNKGGTTENEISTDNGESKNEVAKDENAADGTDIEISEEAGTVDDGEETGTAGESDSAEDINGITNDDGTAEDIDAMSSELSIEHAERDTKAEQTGDEATVTATSIQESDKNEVVEEEELVDWEEQPVKVKNRHDLVLTSETEDDSEEDEINADTTENESGKDVVEEAMNRQGSDSGDETNEEKEDKLKEEQSIEATDAEEEDTVKSKSDSAEDNDAFSNDETSAAETEHEINKPYESKEKEPGETTDCEESDGPEETDPGSQIEGSSKAQSENESEEEGNSSGIDDERSANNLTASTGETTGQEDTSTVKGDDELRDKDSEAKFEDEIAVETSQEYPDENEPLSQAGHVEQLVLAKERKSLGKVEESIEDFQEEKQSKNVETCDVDKLVEDETPLEESESIENESESESKCEDCSEAASKGQKDNKVTDGSEEENEPQFTEEEDEDSDTPHECCSESLGDSADGEDEAEEDSEPEEDTNNGQTSFAAGKLESLDATKRAAKKALLIPLDTLRKEGTESEDGAYADIEDSEHEIHGQKDVTSLESKSLKKV